MFRKATVQMSALLVAVPVAGGLLALHWTRPTSAGAGGDALDGFAGKVRRDRDALRRRRCDDRKNRTNDARVNAFPTHSTEENP
jgi:hypothetical protein